MARSPTPQIGRPTSIRPVAAPVNTYVRPPNPAPSPLHDLAEGLSAFDSGLSSWLQKRQAEQDKADAIRGEAAFNRNNQVGWAEAVASGAVPAHASPVFMEAYKNAQGSHMGVRLREKYNTAYANWEGRNSEDPNAFQTFLSDFIASNITTEDPFILEGLNPHVQALTESAYTTYSTDRANTIYNNHVNTQAALVGDIIDHASIQGITLETGTDYEVLQADILARREEALAAGIRMADFDKHLVSTIAAKAIEHGDPMLLQMLEQTLPGYEVALSSLPEFRDVKATTVAALEVEARRRMQDQADQQEAEDEAKEEAIIRGVMGTLAEDPSAQIPEAVIREWELYDPEARTKLANARSTLLNDNTRENPEDLLRVERMIQEGATVSDILDLAASGIIKDPATFRTLIDRVNRRQEALAGILGSQAARRFLSTIKQRTTPASYLRDLGFIPEGLTDEGIEATREFENMLAAWMLENPNASPLEQHKAVQEMGEAVLSAITEEDIPQYISPADDERMRAEEAVALEEPAAPDTASDSVEGQQPEASTGETDIQKGINAASFGAAKWLSDMVTGGGELDAASPDPQQEPPALSPATVDIFGQDTPPDLQQMDEAARMALEQRAGDFGMTPEEYSLGIWKTVREGLGLSTEVPVPIPNPTPQAGPQSQANPDIFDPTGNKPPEVQRVSPILDLIGDTEGTDRGDAYNETLGYGAYTNGDVELTSMTLDEIDDLQTAMLRHPDNSWNSSALGRYQIVQTTLRGLRDELGLTGNEKFTPELQDRLALALLERRGLSKWLNGQMSDAAFQNALAHEWASLPTTSGSGAYEGQRVGTDTSGLLMALNAIRNPPSNSALDAIGAATNDSVYANIPERELSQFTQWNSNPVANHEANLASIDPTLADVVRRAQELSQVPFVIGSGKRGEDLQRKAIEWGWSKTMESDHLHGGAVDLWPLVDGAVKFDRDLQLEIVRAMRLAAKQLGVDLDVGATWKGFQDLPHFGLKAA